jgi:hypothetical protein
MRVQDWSELTGMTSGAPITVERVRISDKDVVIEGSFELPPLAQLSMEDQIFIVAFLKSHGSIKDMEGLFGVSYPTVKNRLKSIARRLEFVEVDPPASRGEILDQLEAGAISVEQAVERLGNRQ